MPPPMPMRAPPAVTVPASRSSRSRRAVRICACMPRARPWPIASVAITAATPITMPSTVSAGRMRLRVVSAWSPSQQRHEAHQRRRRCRHRRRGPLPDHPCPVAWSRLFGMVISSPPPRSPGLSLADTISVMLPSVMPVRTITGVGPAVLEDVHGSGLRALAGATPSAACPPRMPDAASAPAPGPPAPHPDRHACRRHPRHRGVPSPRIAPGPHRDRRDHAFARAAHRAAAVATAVRHRTTTSSGIACGSSRALPRASVRRCAPSRGPAAPRIVHRRARGPPAVGPSCANARARSSRRAPRNRAACCPMPPPEPPEPPRVHPAAPGRPYRRTAARRPRDGTAAPSSAPSSRSRGSRPAPSRSPSCPAQRQVVVRVAITVVYVTTFCW